MAAAPVIDLADPIRQHLQTAEADPVRQLMSTFIVPTSWKVPQPSRPPRPTSPAAPATVG